MIKRPLDYIWLFMGWIGISVILFLLVNIVASRYIKPVVDTSSVFTKISSPQGLEGLKVLNRIFGSSSQEEALSRLINAPNFEMHPGLHYMTARVENEHYHIGLEGIRYDTGWTNERVREFLEYPNVTFLFGGSTMMGHGVSSNETISYYLNQKIGKNPLPVLNFGSQAYDLQRSTEKLTYLLRIGFRPKKVVFLVGWNEIVGSARSNLRWQDKVIFHGFSVHRGEVSYTPDTSQLNNLKLMKDSLPIIQYLRSKRNGGCPQKLNPARDPFVDGFDFREAYCQFNDWEEYAQKHGEILKEQVWASMKAHNNFIESLSKAFGFEAVIVLQPMGLFDAENPFVTSVARESRGYKYLEVLQNDLRKKIHSEKLHMVDGSDWLRDLKSDKYVDVAHYSPEANKLLAQKLSAYLDIIHPSIKK
jgi:hypothetical protein